jgi:hypothetical protein
MKVFGLFGLVGVFGAFITIVVVGSILAVLGATLFFVSRLLRSMAKVEKERQLLLQTGVQARARVVELQMGTMTMTSGVNRRLELALTVEVHRSGMAPYSAQFKSMVSELHIPQVQPGAWLGVRVDPANPGRMAIEAMGVGPPGTEGAPQRV